PNGLYYNTRGQAGANPAGSQKLVDPAAIVYVDENDLSGGKLKAPLRLEPLILRAAAGERVNVTLTDALPTTDPFGMSGSSNPQFSGTFTITSTPEVIEEWWIAMSGNRVATEHVSVHTHRA